jgi:hypothetical protein
MSGRKAKAARRQPESTKEGTTHPAFEYNEHEPINYAEDARTMLPCEQWDIIEWHPLPDGQGRPTQVHILITPGGPLDEFRFIMRLKSKAACDGMIETLRRHRNSVWGDT